MDGFEGKNIPTNLQETLLDPSSNATEKRLQPNQLAPQSLIAPPPPNPYGIDPYALPRKSRFFLQSRKGLLISILLLVFLLCGFVFAKVQDADFDLSRVVDDSFGTSATVDAQAEQYCIFISHDDYTNAYKYISRKDGKPLWFNEDQYKEHIQTDEGSNANHLQCPKIFVKIDHPSNGPPTAQVIIIYEQTNGTIFPHQYGWFQDAAGSWRIDALVWTQKQFPTGIY